MDHNLLAISPLDGRYANKVSYLSQYFSEAALIRYRCLIEVEWFIFLFNDAKLPGTVVLSSKQIMDLRKIYEEFDVVDAKRVKTIEETTNHDVKAVEYFIAEKLKGTSLEKYIGFIHFSCTSEDINNLSYACMLRDFLSREFKPLIHRVVQEIYSMALDHKSVPMLSHTHGQPASPTTLGKELINYVDRLESELEHLSLCSHLSGKMNGAVGNYNAHYLTYKSEDWVLLTKNFVQSLGLKFKLYTTQIEPHDGFAVVFDSVKRLNNIFMDFSRDMWTYISLGYFGQKMKKGEVGSSTMPHKVNPIDFENTEGNIGVANSLLEHLSSKLQISRLQRDLSDSTAQRNIGSAFSYCVLSYKSLVNGLAKCQINKKKISDDLKDRWELLAEPIQMMMRKNKVENSYEKLKELTRGKDGITKDVVKNFIKSLKIPLADKKVLNSLTPDKYVGIAEKLVDNYELKISEGQSGCGSGGCSGCSGC